MPPAAGFYYLPTEDSLQDEPDDFERQQQNELYDFHLTPPILFRTTLISLFLFCPFSVTEKKEGAIPSVFQERPWKSPVRHTEDNAPNGAFPSSWL